MKNHIRSVLRLSLIGASVVVLFINCGDDDSPVIDNVTIIGTLSLPAEASGKAFTVWVDDNTIFKDGFIKSMQGIWGSGTEMSYSISDVPAGTFYVYAAVCAANDCKGGPQAGYYLGFYGAGLSPPDQPNAVITESGTVTLDITLFEIIDHDRESPSTPTDLVCIVTDKTHVDLSWNASSDNVGVTGYIIYQDGDSLQTVSDTMAVFDGLDCETLYCYRVSAFDTAGNESERSEQTCCTTDHCPDSVPPSTPTGLVCVTIDESQVTLNWVASSDNVEVTGYVVYRDGDSLKAVLGTMAVDSGLSCDNLYCYQISAVDAAENQSLQSGQSCCTTDSCLDTLPPSTPQVMCIGYEDYIEVSWTQSSDNVGVVGYRIYRNGWFWKEVLRCCGVTDTLGCGVMMNYDVSAFDDAGNMSERGGEHCKTLECEW